MNDLTEFLLARIAEDEALAQVAGGEWWYATSIPGWMKSEEHDTWIVDSNKTLIAGNLGEVNGKALADHIANWCPDRVLAECQAKRAIMHLIGDPGPMVPRLLAQPYADHPDYDPTWRLV